jgi:hypothetical protein
MLMVFPTPCKMVFPTPYLIWCFFHHILFFGGYLMVYMVILPPYFMVFPTPFPFWDVGISGDSIIWCRKHHILFWGVNMVILPPYSLHHFLFGAFSLVYRVIHFLFWVISGVYGDSTTIFYGVPYTISFFGEYF